jgi:polysaccharide biosynthesis protein PslG
MALIRHAILVVLIGAAMPAHGQTGPGGSRPGSAGRVPPTRNGATTPRATTRGETMGVFVDLRDDKTAADIAGLGLRWVRIMYNWTWLEPSRGQFNWIEFDQWMARAKAKGLKVLAVAQGSPAWANGGHGPYDKQSGLNTPPLPEFYDPFAHYAAGLVRHGADAIEIWNEPNGGFWLPTPDAKAWARLVARSYDAVKAVNPRIPVITGGVCPLPEGSRNANAPERFLEAALNGVPGFARKFDGVGHHPYVFANDPGAKDPLTAPYQWNPILQTATMQKALARFRAGDKPFWFTEYGVPTGGPFGAVKPEESGTIYRHYYEAFDRLDAQGIKLGPMFFWTLYDILPYQKANVIEGWEGVYDLNGTPKASVVVIKQRAAQRP